MKLNGRYEVQVETKQAERRREGGEKYVKEN